MTIFVPEPPPIALTSEQRVQRRLTTAFIETQPVVVNLVPRAKVKKPSGGFGWTEQPARDPQVMRLIEPGNIPLPVVTVDGVERVSEFELLGEWDSIVANYDIFNVDGYDYEVTRVAHFNGWEQRALVSKFG